MRRIGHIGRLKRTVGAVGGVMTAQGAWQPVTTEFASGFLAFLRDPRTS